MANARHRALLMICYYYPPIYSGGVERSEKFARLLPDFGWRPIVLTTNAYGPDNDAEDGVVRTPELLSVYRWLFNREFREARKKNEKTPVVRRTTPVAGFRKYIIGKVLAWLAIPDPQIGWGAFSLRTALRLLRSEDVEVTLTTSPPESSHVFGLILKGLTGKPWVMDLRDPWTFEPVRDLLRESRYRLAHERALERLCFARADAIVVNTPEATRKYAAMYPARREKMHTITNGFDAAELALAEAEARPPFPWRDPGEGVSVISHVGNFVRHGDGDRPPYRLLDALEEMLDEGVISAQTHRFVFAGDLSPETLEYISRLGLEDVIEAPGVISHFDSMRLVFRSDLLLLFDPSKDGETYVRGKLYQYLGSGKRILGIAPEGATRGLLERAGRGLVAHPDDPEGIRSAMKAMIEKNALPQDVAMRGSSFDLAFYERRRITGELASLLDDVVEKHSPRRA